MSHDFAGSTGDLDIVYSATCTRTSAETIVYPAPGSIQFTQHAISCTAGCTSSQCTAGPG